MNVLTRPRRAARPVAALLLASFLGGCFSYAPVSGTLPRPGARVKVELQTPQEFRAGDLTANDVVEVTGEVISADSSALVLSAFTLTSRSRAEHVTTGETTRVPRLNVASVRENRISPLRTAALTGLVVLGGAIFVSKVANPRGGGNTGGGHGGTTQ